MKVFLFCVKAFVYSILGLILKKKYLFTFQTQLSIALAIIGQTKPRFNCHHIIFDFYSVSCPGIFYSRVFALDTNACRAVKEAQVSFIMVFLYLEIILEI